MQKDDGSKMQKWTLKLRESHPAAAQCRLRRAKGHYELVGTLSDGRRVAKRLKGANDEHEALETAKELTDRLMSGEVTTRTLPQGMVARAETLALAKINQLEVRSATKTYHHRITKECSSWLADRGLLVSQASLLSYYKEPARHSRKRRERIEGARHLARAAKVSLEIAKQDQYQQPLPPERERYSETELLRYLDQDIEVLPKAMTWLIRVVACTGIRGGEALSLKIPKGDIRPGITLVGWSSKRNRPGRTTPSLYNRWMEWDLSNPPNEINELQVSNRQPPTQEQLDKIHRFTNQLGHELRRKCSTEAANALSFRSLRHHATLRLYEFRELDDLQIAETLFTSTEQLRKTYSQLYRHTAAEAVAAAFAKQPAEPITTLTQERAQRIIAMKDKMSPSKSGLEQFLGRLKEATNDDEETIED